MDVKRRLWITFGILVLFRIGTFIPVPGLAAGAAAELPIGGFDLLTGGALGRLSVFALGLGPYIAASIVVAFAAGRIAPNRYTRGLTLLFAALQGFGLAIGMEPNPASLLAAGVSLTAGALALAWFADLITKHGIGEGSWVILWAGAVAELPWVLVDILELMRSGAVSYGFLPVLVLGAPALAGFIVFVMRCQRRVLVQYPKRRIGGEIQGGEATHLPIPPLTGGFWPAVLAAILIWWIGALWPTLDADRAAYLAAYAVLVVAFALFVVPGPIDAAATAANLKQYDGYIPGVRPGKRTEEYLSFVIRRMTALGAAALLLVCLLPEIIVPDVHGPPHFAGPVLLVLIGGMMSFVARIQMMIGPPSGGSGPPSVAVEAAMPVPRTGTDG